MSPKLTLSAVAPAPEKRPVTTEQVGRSRTDDYAWMRDDNWREVMAKPKTLQADIKAHLEAENAYVGAVTADLTALKDEIFEEMKGRLEPEEADVPDPDGPFAYSHRYRKGDQHGIYIRIPIDPATKAEIGPEEIILDADALAKQQDGYFDLGATTHSRDHNWLAYSVDRQGSESYEVFIKPITAPLDKTQTTGITKSAGGVEWAADSQTLFWTERDENQRPYAVFRKNAHDVNDTPVKIYEESDPGFFVGVSESDSGDYIFISAHNHTTTELWLVAAETPKTAPACFSPREDGREYSLHEQGGYFYIETNEGGATDSKIMRCKIGGKTESHKWEEFIPHTSGTLILGVLAYANHLVWLVRENALPKIVIRDMRSGEQHEIAFDEQAYGLGLTGGNEYATDLMRFVYASPTTPRQVIDYNMDTRERDLRKTQAVPSGHTPDDYVTERLNLPARDGTDIPVTLLRREETPVDGSAPLLLYGYGSYGITIPAGFRTSILSLVDRGFVYAIAHVRGGMAKGYQWYLDGKLDKKINTFTDFVDVGNALVSRHYTARGRIVSHGGSAGGMLVGAALNIDPELFGGVIAAVPFVDVLNTMSDDTLPLTPPEWPEWGNPLESADDYDRILTYSPYENVTEAAYPPVLITAGLTDPRVTYWEPAKWAATLREHQTADAPILMKTNMEAGHQGESGRYDSLKEAALEYAFAVSVVG